MSKIRVDEIVDVVDEGSPDLPYGATCAEPTAHNEVATKSYVDSSLSGTFANTVSSTAPANAAIGSFWVDNSTAYNVLKCWNGSAWEEFSGMVGGTSYLIGIVDPEVLTPGNKAGHPSVPYIPSTSEITNITYHGGGLATSGIGVAADIQAAAYGDGKFVAVSRGPDNGANGTDITNDQRVQWSPDGLTWNAVDHAEGNYWKGVTYGNGKFVAVSGDGGVQGQTTGSALNPGTNRVMWSTDAINWNAATAALNIDWHSVAYGEPNGQPMFVAVAANGDNRAMYSTDGINWTITPTTNDANGWTGVVWGDGKFVAIAGSGIHRAMYSTDGIDWSSGAEGLGFEPFTCIGYGEPNGQPTFVAVANGTDAFYSHDAINWSRATVPEAGDWRNVAYGEPNGQPTFLAVAEKSDPDFAYTNKTTMYSNDGITWVTSLGAQVPNSSTIYNWGGPVVYGEGKFIKFATWAMSTSNRNIVGYSYDGMTWASINERLTLADDKIRMLDTGEVITGQTLGTILIGGELLYDYDSANGGTVAASGLYSPTPGGPTNMITLYYPTANGIWTVGMKLRSANTANITYDPAWPIWDTATSSIPAVSKGAVSVWGTVEWNVAEDSAFTTNLQSSKVNIVKGEVQPMPSDIVIEANKEYYVRVRYGSLDPAVSFSNWSPANIFKTEEIVFPGTGASPWTDPNSGVIYTYTNGVWFGNNPAT